MNKEVTLNKNMIKASGLMFIIAPLFFLIVEFVASRFWGNPAYSYISNYISDLGVPVQTMFQGRQINSPLSSVMNFGFVMYANLFVIGNVLIFHALSKNGRIPRLVLNSLYSLGIIFVGIFPGYDWPGLPMHVIGAFLVIVIGNIGIIMTGTLLNKTFKRKNYSIISMLLGILGLLGLVLVTVAASAGMSVQGLCERIAVYPMLVWSLLTGLMLFTNKK